MIWKLLTSFAAVEIWMDKDVYLNGFFSFGEKSIHSKRLKQHYEHTLLRSADTDGFVMDAAFWKHQ